MMSSLSKDTDMEDSGDSDDSVSASGLGCEP